MNNNLEMVEELRKNADISYRTAYEVLEGTNWDMDSARTALKKEGIYREETAAMTTTNYTKENTNTDGKERYTFRDVAKKGRTWFGDKFRKGLRNDFCIETKGGKVFAMPVTVMIILSIIGIEIVPILLVIAFFMGCRFSFEGPDLGDSKINEDISKIRFESRS